MATPAARLGDRPLSDTRRALRRRRSRVRDYVADLVASFEEHDLLTSASAISFQIFTAIVPFLLFGFALLGFLNLDTVWRDDIAVHIRPHLSAAAFTVINDTVTKVLSSRQVFWMTGGLALTVWQVSGAVRAVMGALNRIYRVRRQRSWRERMTVSLALAVAVGGLLLAALAAVTLIPLAYGDVGQPAQTLLFVARWCLAGLLMLAAVGLLLRHAPAKMRPLQWVSFGTMLIIGSWIAMSLAFAGYLQFIANYESVFGNLATVVVLLGYIYLSSVVFLAGAQLDALVRRRVEGN
jgi:membrane protein